MILGKPLIPIRDDLAPQIVVTGPTGATVSCDGVVGTEVSGKWTFKTTIGTHTLVLTIGGKSDTRTVLVDRIALISLEMGTPIQVVVTNPNSNLVFYSLNGALYTDDTLQNPVQLNTQYTEKVFYYDCFEGATTGSYLYKYNNGPATDGTWRTAAKLCTIQFISQRYTDGSLTTMFGTSGYCWSISIGVNCFWINLATGECSEANGYGSSNRCCAVNF